MAIVGIDFDHVLCDTAHVEPGHKMGPPMDGGLEALRQIARTGNVIVIFTARATSPSGRQAVEQWLHYYGVSNLIHSVTAIKTPSIQVYIDDRGYRFVDWQTTLKDLPSLLRYNPKSDSSL